MDFPALSTKRLVLTEIKFSDLDAIFRLFSNPQVVKFYDLAAFNEVSQAQKLLSLFASRYKEKAGIRWAIRLKDSGDMIGTCGFNSWNEKMKNATLGYDLMPEHWRQGYAFEAVHAIVEAAFFGDLACGAIHRIQADTVPENIQSETLLKRLGFKEEGLRRDCAYWDGAFQSLKCFGLLKHEFD